MTRPVACVTLCFVELALFKLLLPPSFRKTVPAVPVAKEGVFNGDVFSRIVQSSAKPLL
jgi:hypothetical protein